MNFRTVSLSVIDSAFLAVMSVLLIYAITDGATRIADAIDRNTAQCVSR